MLDDVSTFNRTIEELKRIIIPDSKIPFFPFNRTIEELKRGRATNVRGLVLTFNRTIEELKQHRLRVLKLSPWLLIAPLRN